MLCENGGKWKGRQLPGIEPRTPLVWATCALPLSHNSQTLWGLVVVQLSWFSGRPLSAQARGVLDLTPSNTHAVFSLFSIFASYLITSNLISCCMQKLWAIKNWRASKAMEQAAFRRHNYKQLIAVSFPGSLHQESPPNQETLLSNLCWHTWSSSRPTNLHK